MEEIKQQKREPCQRIFIGNIPFDKEEKEIRELFELIGPIKKLEIKKDQIKRYAFCLYSDVESAQTAIKNLNQHEFGGRSLVVNYANADEKIARDITDLFDFEEFIKQHQHQSFSEVINDLTKPQKLFLLHELKELVQIDRNSVKKLLVQNPKFAECILKIEQELGLEEHRKSQQYNNLNRSRYQNSSGQKPLVNPLINIKVDGHNQQQMLRASQNIIQTNPPPNNPNINSINMPHNLKHPYNTNPTQIQRPMQNNFNQQQQQLQSQPVLMQSSQQIPHSIQQLIPQTQPPIPFMQQQQQQQQQQQNKMYQQPTPFNNLSENSPLQQITLPQSPQQSSQQNFRQTNTQLQNLGNTNSNSNMINPPNINRNTPQDNNAFVQQLTRIQNPQPVGMFNSGQNFQMVNAPPKYNQSQNQPGDIKMQSNQQNKQRKSLSYVSEPPQPQVSQSLGNQMPKPNPSRHLLSAKNYNPSPHPLMNPQNQFNQQFGNIMRLATPQQSQSKDPNKQVVSPEIEYDEMDQEQRYSQNF